MITCPLLYNLPGLIPCITKLASATYQIAKRLKYRFLYFQSNPFAVVPYKFISEKQDKKGIFSHHIAAR
jgi:hypothetical protein